MAVKGCLFFCLLLVLCFDSTTVKAHNNASLNRSNFPEGFVFGIGTASYQYEGAAKEGGRGPSIWDKYTHEHPERIFDGSSGDVANDFYHRYKEDVSIVKDIGFDALRLSISWPRILPKGKLSGGVNEEGIKFYNNLIDEILAKGIQPFVTLFHWDLPQALDDEYGGLLNSEIVNDFHDYVNICFKHFGDRVKHWFTLNEPATFSQMAYAQGLFAPGRCSNWQIYNCTGGDSGTEPYMVGHNLLLAHAAAVKLYKTTYQATQKGKIGITLSSNWYVPYSDSNDDKKAAERALDFQLGWFLNPLTHGKYPNSMRSLVGKRLPKFSAEQSNMLKNSFDFLGLNYYTAQYAAHIPKSEHASYLSDHRANLTYERNGVFIGPRGASDWIYIYPRGIRDLLLYTKKTYNPPVIYITENGIDEVRNDTKTLKEALVDNHRIDYFYHHLSFLEKAIKDGVNVKGYFAWTLLDDFEWPAGYTIRFGLNYVDYKDGLKRYSKLSVEWFKKFLKH